MSVTLITFTLLCNHYYHVFPDLFHLSILKLLYPSNTNASFPPPSQPLWFLPPWTWLKNITVLRKCKLFKLKLVLKQLESRIGLTFLCWTAPSLEKLQISRNEMAEKMKSQFGKRITDLVTCEIYWRSWLSLLECTSPFQCSGFKRMCLWWKILIG